MFDAEQAPAGCRQEQALGGDDDGAHLPPPEAAKRAATAAACRAAAAGWPPRFWDDAKRYADRSGDGLFVRELAYLLVTLHRHGA